MNEPRVLGALLLGAVACSSAATPTGGATPSNDGRTSPASGGNSVSGTIGAMTPTIGGAIGFYRSVALGSSKGLDLLMSSNAPTCSAYPGRTLSQFNIQIPGAPLSAGTYHVIDSSTSGAGVAPLQGQASALFATMTDCNGSTSDFATGGTITITDSTSDHIVGVFDITFKDGRVSGTIDIPVCEGDGKSTKFDCQ